MSKLTKLLRDPAGFVRDSKVYRKLLFASRSVDRVTLRRRSSGSDDIVADLADWVPMVDVTHEGIRTLALLREHTPDLVSWIAQRSSVSLVAHPVGTRDLSGMSAFEVDELLRRLHCFTLHAGTASVVVELWRKEASEYVGPTSNPVARRIDRAAAAELGLFARKGVRHVRELLRYPLPTAVDLEIDVVYTWVNHDDPGWRALWRATVGTEPEHERDDTRGLDRFRNRDELMYSLRSLQVFAPWVRRIHIVSNCAAPPWLDVSHPKVRWVDHDAILPADGLPVFNSHAIESRLHHVPDLAEHFLYFNDDFFLMRALEPSHFFLPNGMSKAFVEPHGSVNGDPQPQSPDYLNAARNGRRLIEEAFQRSPTSLHLHTPYALRRDVLRDMEQQFSEPIGRTSRSRFRHVDDISTVSFLYHHYAFVTGRAVYTGLSQEQALLVQPRASDYPERLRAILEGASRPLTLCLNDGGGSGDASEWGDTVVDFLEAAFPDRCSLERSGGDGS